MDTLIWFVASLAALVFVVRWIHQHIHGVAFLWTGHPDTALLLYSLLLLPGVLLHELSHVVVATLLGVRTSGFTIVPRRGNGGHIALGSVMVERVDVVRASLIGAAPLLAGCAVVLVIGEQVFRLSTVGYAFASGQGPAVGEALSRLFGTPDAWLWLYLIFAVSNTMLPSDSDRETWPPVLLFVASVAVLVLITDGGTLRDAVAQPVGAAVTWLTAAFLVTLAIDVCAMGLIAVLERGTELISGRRIYYTKPGGKRRRGP